MVPEVRQVNVARSIECQATRIVEPSSVPRPIRTAARARHAHKCPEGIRLVIALGEDWAERCQSPARKREERSSFLMDRYQVSMGSLLEVVDLNQPDAGGVITSAHDCGVSSRC